MKYWQIGPILTQNAQKHHFCPCPTTCDWCCCVYGTPCPPPYHPCPPQGGATPLLPNNTQAVITLLHLPNYMELMLSCIWYPHPCLPSYCPCPTTRGWCSCIRPCYNVLVTVFIMYWSLVTRFNKKARLVKCLSEYHPIIGRLLIIGFFKNCTQLKALENLLL